MTVIINGDTGISGVNGSAATPAIQGGDADTGIFFGTNTASISTGGTSRVNVDANGNCGIGVLTPSSDLHIAGQAPALKIEATGNSPDRARIILDAPNATNVNRRMGEIAGLGVGADDGGIVISSRKDGALTQAILIERDGHINFGINTDSPSVYVLGVTPIEPKVVINGDAGSGNAGPSSLGIRRQTNNTNGGFVAFMKDRGSQVTAVNSGDTLGGISFSGSDATNYRAGAAIQATAAADYGPIVDATGGSPAGLILQTTPAGMTTVQTRLDIRSDGNVLIGTSVNRDALLQVGTNRGSSIATPYFCAGDGIILKYYCDGTLGVTQRRRFTFAVGSRDSALLEIKAIGRRAGSNTASMFETGIYAARLYATSAGVCGINGNTMLMGYGITVDNFVFTDQGNFVCTLDFDNPTPNTGVVYAFDICLTNAVGNQVQLTSTEVIDE